MATEPAWKVDERNSLVSSNLTLSAKMNVNQKGVVGLVKVISDLVSRGYEVFTPISDFCPVDIIVADSKMNLRRIQVKYREHDNRNKNAIVVQLDSIVNGKRVPVDVSLIDGWAIYFPETNEIYYVPKSEVQGRSIWLCIREYKLRRNKLASKFLDPDRIFGEAIQQLAMESGC